ncbi:MAG: hypothetical protein ABL932_09215 [Terricaulis sp.]
MSQALDTFGQIVVGARDSAFGQFDRTLSGQAKAPSRRELSAKLASLGEDERKLVRWAVREAVDTALHDLLFALYADDRVLLAFEQVDLKDTSDGFQGDYVTEEGWVGRFSKYPAA